MEKAREEITMPQNEYEMLLADLKEIKELYDEAQGELEVYKQLYGEL